MVHSVLLAVILFAVLPGPAAADQLQVLDTAAGDVTGDGRPDRLALLGEPFEPGVAFLKQIFLHIEYGGGPVRVIPLPEDAGAGYQPTLRLCDLTGDGVPEAFIDIATGGSGGIFNALVYTFAGAKATLILDTARDQLVHFSGTFLPGFRAKLIIVETDETHTLDLSSRRGSYIEAGIYNEKGDLPKPVDLWGGGYGLVRADDRDGDGICEFVGWQAVSGYVHVDQVAVIESRASWQENAWKVREIIVRPPGYVP